MGGADRDSSIAGLQQRIDLVVRQAFSRRVDGDRFSFQTKQSTGRGDPDGAFPICDDVEINRDRQPRIAGVDREPFIFEPRHPACILEQASEREPDATVRILVSGAHRSARRQSVPFGVAGYPAIAQAVDAGQVSQPQVPLTIFVRGHPVQALVPIEPERVGNLPSVFQLMHATRINGPLRAGRAPVEQQSGVCIARRRRNGPLPAPVVGTSAGDDYQFVTGVRTECDRLASSSLGHCVSGENAVAVCHELARVGSGPQRPISVFVKRDEAVVGDRRRVALVEDGEVHAVEARQPIECRQPQITVTGLHDRPDGVLRQPVVGRPVVDQVGSVLGQDYNGGPETEQGRRGRQ